MTEQKHGPGDLPTSERMGTLARAATDALQHKASGEHETQHGAGLSVSLADAEAIIATWPDAPRNGARQMLGQYGAPNEATPTKLWWYHKGPWKRILVTSDVIVHNFPAPHTDYLTQWIDYRVPVEKFDAIGRYDGSCLVDRTAGEAGARCDSEAANMITLNLMHEIVTGQRTWRRRVRCMPRTWQVTRWGARLRMPNGSSLPWSRAGRTIPTRAWGCRPS